MVFLLYGDVVSLPELVERLHRAGKLAVVHADLIAGLGSRDVAVDYIHAVARADGIISTRPAFIRRGGSWGFSPCCGFLCLTPCPWTMWRPPPPPPSRTWWKFCRHHAQDRPAGWPRDLRCPLICGGLIMDKSDVVEALSAGALAVSTTSEAVWDL